MNTIKSLALVGLATTALFASQAFATACQPAPVGGSVTQGSPVCIATTSTDGANKDLQSQLNLMTTSGPQIDVYNDQASPSAYWAIGASGQSANKIMLEIAGNAGSNTFGIFDKSNAGNYLQLFSGAAGAGYSTLLAQIGNVFTATYFDAMGAFQSQSSITMSGNEFGYYLGATGSGPAFYSDPTMNAPGGSLYPDGMRNMVAYAGNGQTYLNGKAFLGGESILAWEDQAFANSDLDYNDFVVLVESVHSVPEPGVLGMFGLGALLIGGFVGMRRRYLKV